MKVSARKITLIFGLAAAGVAAIGLASWREIAVQYHLYYLRTDPEYLSQILDRPEGTIQGDAVEKFLRSGPSADGTIFKTLMAHTRALGLGRKFNGRFRLEPEGGIVLSGSNISLTLDNDAEVNHKIGIWGNSPGPETLAARLCTLQEILAGHHFTCKDPPDYQGAEFVFQEDPSGKAGFNVQFEDEGSR